MSDIINYDPNRMLNLVCGKIQELRKKELSYEEVRYVMAKIKTINASIFNGRKLSDVIPVMAKVYLEDLKKLEKYQTKEDVDVHAYLSDTIGNAETTGGERKIEPEATLDSLLQTPKTLLSIINPKALIKKSYLLLDRRYQSAEGDDSKLFTWNVVTTGGTFDKWISAVSTMEIKDIVAIRLHPFRFPNTPIAFGNDNTITVEIVELNAQAYVSAATHKRFHFSFNIFRQTPLYGVLYSGTQEPFKTSDLGSEGAVIHFREPIAKLDNISIRFGNPFNTLTLDPCKLPASVSAVGAQTQVDFGLLTPHYCAIGDIITFTTFNTSNPTADHDTITSVNDVNGWYITAITSTTVTVDIDLSALVGAIVGNPMTIWLDAKRFILRLEIDYIDQPSKEDNDV